MYCLPNILNKLEDIKDIKSDIKNALINKGQNMTNVSFVNYPEKIENLKCNLTFISFQGGSTEELNKNIGLVNLSILSTGFGLFKDCYNLIEAPNFNMSNMTNIGYMFDSCINLTNIPTYDTSNITNMSGMFNNCNNLNNESIQNIINMCLNSNITGIMKNLDNTNIYSPLYNTIFDNSYYQNRWSDLDTAGWSY